MKKRNVLIICGMLLVLVLVGVYFVFSRNGDTILTIDINPSIEITIDRNDNVKKIRPLNEDANVIVSSDMENISFKEAMGKIVDKLIENDFIRGEENIIVIGVEGKDYSNLMNEVFAEKNVKVDIIKPEISEEAKELALQHGITEAKAALLLETVSENEQLNIDDFVEKSINEINETKLTGKYCDSDYNLEGDRCVKVIGETAPIVDTICPSGYNEYKGKCYEEIGTIESENLKCNEQFNLVDGKCVREITVNAIPNKYTCASGTLMTRVEAGITRSTDGDAKDMVCVDTSNATHPMSPCEVNDGTEYLLSSGKCYWHRAPVIASGCPGKIQVGGFCWDDASNILICKGARDGKRYSSRNEFCEGSVKYTNPSVTEYKCSNSNAKLSGTKCTFEETEEGYRERTCPNGFTLTENRCLNYNNVIDKVIGYRCQGENSRLEKDVCQLLDIKEPLGE